MFKQCVTFVSPDLSRLCVHTKICITEEGKVFPLYTVCETVKGKLVGIITSTKNTTIEENRDEYVGWQSVTVLIPIPQL